MKQKLFNGTNWGRVKEQAIGTILAGMVLGITAWMVRGSLVQQDMAEDNKETNAAIIETLSRIEEFRIKPLEERIDKLVESLSTKNPDAIRSFEPLNDRERPSVHDMVQQRAPKR